MSEDDTTVPPMLFDRYRVGGILGEGGIGSVVRAFDTRLRRVVAIKTLKRTHTSLDPTQLQRIEDRFAREAHAGSRMGSHPNLVAVYDLAADSEGTLYLILEYVAGGTLSDRIRASSALPLADVLRLTADTARGLHAAHEVGIVHRDIKPANIFIAADGRAQVGDFGIAQIDDVSGRTQTTVGHPGTPLYMSPEQARMTGYLRPSSDQYSLGLTIFEMLTARAYKRLETREAAAMLAAQPRPVAALIERLISEDPADRYPSMANVLQATQAISNVMDNIPNIADQQTSPAASQTPATYPPPETPRGASSQTPLVALQPAPAVQGPPQTPPHTPPHTPVPYPEVPQYSVPPYSPSQYTPPPRMGRRAVLLGIGGLAVVGAGAAGGAYFVVGRDKGAPATATPQQVAAGSTRGATDVSSTGTPTAPPTATATPAGTATPTPRPHRDTGTDDHAGGGEFLVARDHGCDEQPRTVAASRTAGAVIAEAREWRVHGAGNEEAGRQREFLLGGLGAAERATRPGVRGRGRNAPPRRRGNRGGRDDLPLQLRIEE